MKKCCFLLKKQCFCCMMFLYESREQDIDTEGEYMKFRKVKQVLIVSALVCSMSAVPVYAAPEGSIDSLEDEQSELKDQKNDAQDELNSLQTQLETLLSKVAELEDKLISTGQKISQAKDDLVVAEEKRQDQYDSMKLRIKYMYESGGDTAALEKVLTSGDITSMLTQAEYSQQVHNYDRAQLKEYADTVQEIQDLEDTLETEMTDLQALEADYQEQQDELNTTIASKQDEISNLDGMIQEAARKIVAERQRQEEEARQQQEAASNDSNGGEQDNAPADSPQTSAPSQDVQTPSEDNGGGDDSYEEPAQDTGGGSEPSYDSSSGNAAVDRAMSKQGLPYAWGEAGPDSFDCSGLVSYALTGSYVHTWTTYDFMSWPRVSDPQPGDVCTTSTHCGLYIGGGMMVHAPHSGDVVKVSAVQSGLIYGGRP